MSHVEYHFMRNKDSLSPEKDSSTTAKSSKKSSTSKSWNRKLKSKKFTASTDSKIEKEIHEKANRPAFVGCCEDRFGSGAGERCESGMNLIYCILDLHNRDLLKKVKRILGMSFIILGVLASVFFVIISIKKMDTETKVSFWANLCAAVSYSILLFLQLIIPKLEDFWIFFGLGLSFMQVDVVHLTNQGGLMDGASLAISSLLLYISFYALDSTTQKLFWVFVWLANVVVNLLIELMLQNIDQLIYDIKDDFQNKIIAVYVSIFMPTFVSIFAFFFRTKTEVGHVKTIAKEQKRHIDKIKVLEDDLDVLIEEKKAENKKPSVNIKLNADLFTIDSSEITLMKQIGKGGSDATIYKSSWKDDIVAFKVFKIKDFNSQEYYEEFEKEVKIMSQIKHKGILEFYGCTLRPPRVGIVMEYCENGDVMWYINKTKLGKKDMLTFFRKVSILAEVCEAMVYLHNRNIIHRDLKCQNILLRKDMSSRIIDFGLSRLVDRMSVKKTKRIGTSVYMAPEVILGNVYDEKCDIYSLALIMWEMITEDFHPYGRNIDYNIEMKVANDHSFRPQIPEKFKKNEEYNWYFSLMKECWNGIPDMRPDFQELTEKFGKYQKILKMEDDFGDDPVLSTEGIKVEEKKKE